MANETLQTGLWTHRSIDETQQIYSDWAARYDADVVGAGYATPERLAHALAQFADLDTPVLDFGCGTGLSGIALAQAGFQHILGTDINSEMLAQIPLDGPYAKTWVSQPGGIDQTAEASLGAIAAIGVISLGAAPPDMLGKCLTYLKPGGVFGFSFNDPTLAEGRYDTALEQLISMQRATVLFRQHGPHLSAKNMGSDVIILQKNP